MERGLVEQGMYKEQEKSHPEWPDHTGGKSTFGLESFNLLATFSLFSFMSVSYF